MKVRSLAFVILPMLALGGGLIFLKATKRPAETPSESQTSPVPHGLRPRSPLKMKFFGGVYGPERLEDFPKWLAWMECRVNEAAIANLNSNWDSALLKQGQVGNHMIGYWQTRNGGEAPENSW